MSLRYDDTALDPKLSTYAPLPRAVACFVLARGGSWRLAIVAAEATRCDLDGHSEHLIVPMAAEALASEAMVGTPGNFDITRHAFVVDGERFQLARNYCHERDIALALAARLAIEDLLAPITEADLAALFGGVPSPEAALQTEAVRRAPGRRLFVLTGGPGTGKTTTVVRMLAAFAREHAARNDGVVPRVRLAAPTGKAAQRLQSAFEAGRDALAGDADLPAQWQRALAALDGVSATTIHRLLGARGTAGGFAHAAADPLPVDVVVVDEASMVDLALMRALVDALPPHATLILVGDADQLTSIGTGSVLRDVVDALESIAPDSVVRLQYSFRAERALAALNAAVRSGDPADFADACSAAGEAVVVASTARTGQLRARLCHWAERLADELSAAGALDPWDPSDAGSARDLLSVLAGRQLLGVVREGGHGVVNANRIIDGVLRARMGAEQDRWYPGRAVIVTRNDRASGLVNGDVGIVRRDLAGRLRVVFDGPDGLRTFAPSALPEHDCAFALTVHKSQGSEYARVAVLLPPDPGHNLLSRQLLYTALTRARRAVELWAAPDVVAAALARPVDRATALARRLRG
jgi:exodeoxyribonuclease V alpha subunit